MNYTGNIIGILSFLVIGIFHPVVIKCEYYFSDKIWPVFLVGGLGFCVGSLFVPHPILSAVLSLIGFALLWSILELRHQTERVAKGWFPANPNRLPKTVDAIKTEVADDNN